MAAIPEAPDTLLFRVGDLPTREEIAAITPEQWHTRTVLDPRFSDAAYEGVPFDWHDYISIVEPPNREVGDAIRLALDQFSQTPEGRQLLRQAAEMQRLRLEHGSMTGMPVQSGNVCIEQGGLGGMFLDYAGILHLDVTQMLSVEGDLIGGGTAEFSLQRILYHELMHAADPFTIGSDGARSVFQSHLQRVTEIMRMPRSPERDELLKEADARGWEPYGEIAPMTGSNSFMQGYYGERPFIPSHTSARFDTTPHPFEDHVHPTIQIPPIAPSTPALER